CGCTPPSSRSGPPCRPSRSPTIPRSRRCCRTPASASSSSRSGGSPPRPSAGASRARTARAIASGPRQPRRGRSGAPQPSRAPAPAARAPAAPPISPEMLALLDEGLAANLQRTHELSAAVEVLRADRTALELKSGDLEARVAAAESIEVTLRGMNADLAARLDESARERAKEVGLLEGQRAEARDELYRVQTSRLWRTVNVYWRARRAAARL